MEPEYRALIIPLGFSRTTTVHGHLSDRGAEERGRQEARARYRSIVDAHLRQAAAEGWQAAEAVEFDAAAAAGRLRVSTHVSKDRTVFAFGDVRATIITHNYESVTIRLRRAT